MKNITMIAAIGQNNELGKNNDLIWHFKEDMKFFRNQTINKPILMGRKTLESLPKLLPKRKHIVLSRRSEGFPEEVLVINSKEEALKWIENYSDEVMIIGGASIYKEFLDYSEKLVLTEIEASDKDADVFFPNFNKDEWNEETLSEHVENNIKYKHKIYTRK